MFSVTSTSKSRGRRIRCMAAAVDQHVLELHVGEFRRARRRAHTSRHSREVSSTLDLSMEVSLPAPPARQLAATRVMRSISSTV